MLAFLTQAAGAVKPQEVVQTTTKAYEVLLQYGAIGACLVIFIILFIKILADNKRLGNLLLDRDAAHDKDIMEVHKAYTQRLDTAVHMLVEEKDARRAELFKVATDYAEMVNTVRDLGASVRALIGRG